MFDAVWKGGDLASLIHRHGLKSRMPDHRGCRQVLQGQQAGVPVEKFLATAKSFSVDLKVRAAEDLIDGYTSVDRTPTIIVNGKYRVHVESAGGPDS